MQPTNVNKFNIKAPVLRAKEGLKGYIGYEGYKVQWVQMKSIYNRGI